MAMKGIRRSPRRFAAVAVAVASACCTLAASGHTTSALAQPAGSVRVVILLADNTLVITPLRGPRRLTLHLGRHRRGKVPPPRALAKGRLSGHAVVFVLVNGQTNSRIAVAVDNGAVIARYALPDARRYAALIRVRDSLYAFGNDSKRRAIVVRIIAGGVAQIVHVGRKAFVYDGAVDARARYAVISYHGARSTGADVIPLTPGGPSCLHGPTPSDGCLEIHGAVVARGNLVLATFGGEGLRIIRLDGTIVRTLPVPLKDNHFVAMAISPRGLAVLPGSRGYDGGIATVNATTGRVRIVVPAPKRHGDGTFGSALGCGDNAALGPNSLVAITQPSVPVPQPDGTGRVVVWQHWHVVARYPTHPDPVDVALIRT
jgi:hypothetical protein